VILAVLVPCKIISDSDWCFIQRRRSFPFVLISPDATYWAFGFPTAVIAVTGTDFIFATGSLFIAKVAKPHEQSVTNAVFQAMTRV
jgi:hypothetical protein